MKIKIQKQGEEKIKSFQSMKQFAKWMECEFGQYVINYKSSRQSKSILNGDWRDAVEQIKENGELIFKCKGCHHAWVRG